MALNYLQTKVRWAMTFGFGFLGGDDGCSYEEFYGIAREE